jgi:hypothetical protein
MSTGTRSQTKARDEVSVEAQPGGLGEEEAAASSGGAGSSSKEDVADATEATFQAPKSRPDDERLEVMLHWQDPRFNEHSIKKQYGHSIRTQYRIELSLSFHLVASRY